VALGERWHWEGKVARGEGVGEGVEGEWKYHERDALSSVWL